MEESARALLLDASDERPDSNVAEVEEQLLRVLQRVRGRLRRDPQGLVVTPRPVAASLHALMKAAFPREWERAELILDPAVGSGRLLPSTPGKGAVGWDVDEAVLRLARVVMARRARAGSPSRAQLRRVDGLRAPRPEASAGALAVVCNPPYVAAYARASQAASMNLSSLGRISGRWGTGRTNVAVAFVARVVRDVLRPGEIAGFILPDALLNAPRYEALRREWFEHVDAFVVARCAERTFAGRGVRGVLVACRRASRSAWSLPSLTGGLQSIRFADATPEEVRWTGSLAAATLRAQPDAIVPWPTPTSALAFGLLEAGVGRLDAVVSAHDGVNPGPRAAREALIDDAPGRLGRPRPLLEGKDVHAGRVDAARLFIDVAPQAVRDDWRRAGTSLRKPGLFDGPRLYSRQTASRLTLAFVDDQTYATNAVHVLRARGAADAAETLRRVAAVLNTETATRVYQALFGEDRALFPQVKLVNLRRLPMPWPLREDVAAAADAWASAPTDAALAAVDRVLSAWWRELAAPQSGAAEFTP